jgi:hypothetical protein
VGRIRTSGYLAALCLSLCVACSAGPAPTPPVPAAPPAPTAPPAPAVPSAAAAPGCPAPDAPDGWSCAQRQRFAAVTGYLRPRLGEHDYLAVVFTDRRTGLSWRTGDTGHPGWTASTIKLAVAADLLARQRAGQVALSPADRHDMDTMLNSSDEAATDRLWRRYGGQPMLDRFRSAFGMTGLHFVPGFTRTPYWGFVKCGADDLAALLRHVFTATDPADRAYLVSALRGVADNQRWGVWAAGADQRPGNKDGWSDEQDPYGRHWVTSTAGFAGPDQRYLVVVTYQLAPGRSMADGVHQVSDTVALLFGRPVPAPVSMPVPDG